MVTLPPFIDVGRYEGRVAGYEVTFHCAECVDGGPVCFLPAKDLPPGEALGSCDSRFGTFLERAESDLESKIAAIARSLEVEEARIAIEIDAAGNVIGVWDMTGADSEVAMKVEEAVGGWRFANVPLQIFDDRGRFTLGVEVMQVFR